MQIPTKNKQYPKIQQKSNIKAKLINKATINEKHQLLVCKFGIEDTMVACGYSDGYVRIYNMNTTNKITQINTNRANLKTPVNCLRWRPINQQGNVLGNALLVANTDGNLYQYIAKTGKEMCHISEQPNYILSMDYSTDGKQFATAGKDNVVRIYDQQTKKVKSELKSVEWNSPGHNNRLFCVKFKPDQSNLIVSGGWDQNVNIWDIREASVIAGINGPKICGDSIDIRDNLILTGSNRGVDQLQLWDWRKNKLLSSFRWDQSKQQTNAFIFGCQFLKSDNQLVAAVGSNQLKIFSLNDFSEMAVIDFEKDQSLYSIDTSLTTHKIITGGKKGNLFYFASLKGYE